MKEFFSQSAYLGVSISLIGYMIGDFLKRKTKLAIFQVTI